EFSSSSWHHSCCRSHAGFARGDLSTPHKHRLLARNTSHRRLSHAPESNRSRVSGRTFVVLWERTHSVGDRVSARCQYGGFRAWTTHQQRVFPNAGRNKIHLRRHKKRNSDA